MCLGVSESARNSGVGQLVPACVPALVSESTWKLLCMPACVSVAVSVCVPM